jgi:sialic acid synthase SpsE
MKIGQTTIGSGKPYIIAEIGVNHDGDPARAVALTRLAAKAGADAIKLQLFEASRLMSAASRLAVYQAAAGEQDPLAMLRRLELSIDDMRPCVDAAHALGMHAIVSVFSVELVEVAERLPWDAYKTASPDVIHRPLLETLARTGRPLIVSTGAATIEEIRRAVDWLQPWHPNLALLQCVSSYPTPAEHAELGGIPALRRAFPSLPIGYSDHTPDTTTGATAVALGAVVLEKHFTDNRHAKGPDHAASLDPAGFAEYCRLARGPEAPSPSVEPVKRVIEIEGDVRAVSRQSIVPRRPLGRGTLLAREDLTFKRPGTGLAPFELDRVLGRRVLRDVASDVPLMKEDVDGFQS